MQVGPRLGGKTYIHEDGTSEYWWVRKINGKRFLFHRFENDHAVSIRVGLHSTRHWFTFPKEAR